MDGKVKRVYKDKGYGFIKTSDGQDYFFHQSELQNEKFERLKEGQDVEFQGDNTSKGLRATQVYVQ